MCGLFRTLLAGIPEAGQTSEQPAQPAPVFCTREEELASPLAMYGDVLLSKLSVAQGALFPRLSGTGAFFGHFQDQHGDRKSVV